MTLNWDQGLYNPETRGLSRGPLGYSSLTGSGKSHPIKSTLVPLFAASGQASFRQMVRPDLVPRLRDGSGLFVFGD